MAEQPSRELVDLARECGVATEYWDFRGKHVTVGAETIRKVLGALGVDASDDAAVRAAAAARDEAKWARVIPPAIIARSDRDTEVTLRVPEGAHTVRVTLESGGVRDLEITRGMKSRQVEGAQVTKATVRIPAHLEHGWHEAAVIRGDGQGEPVATATLAVVPSQVPLPKAVAANDRQRWGLMAQVYATRSDRSWGTGDLADAADVGAFGATLGADFLLLNPLHAAEPTAPMEASPYLPTSRRFVNPLYLRVEAIPEVAYMSAAERQIVEWHADDARRLNSVDLLDRDEAWRQKEAALRLVWRQPKTVRRDRAFQTYLEAEGQGLLDFATWCALSAKHGRVWQDWPAELHDPRSEAVAKAREEMFEDVDFYCWLQWNAAEQLAALQSEMRTVGMDLGVIHDLAVGVHPCGADAWCLGDALARGVTVGAPPDQYNQLGQDWSQPPWRPDRLVDLGYAPFRDMIRSVLRDSGGVRIDHIIGLFRLWWIPEGNGPDAGTYVHYDHDALLGILALEAERAGALVIGEDLGTVEDWMRDALTERGLLGTSVLWFEYEGDRPRQPEKYRRLCLATATTHDLPPNAGFLEGEHMDVRERLGLIDGDVAQARAEDEAGRAKVLGMLRERGLLRPGASTMETVEALHRALTKTPSLLVGVSVSDLAGDKRTINQPGTYLEYPNWRVPLADGEGNLLPIEELARSRPARRLARTVRRG